MIQAPMDVLNRFPIRRTPAQKAAFRESVCRYVSDLGLSCTVEETKKNCHNIIIGDIHMAKHLITAHYDTPASIGIPNMMIPCNMLFFIGYQMLVLCVFFLAAFIFGGIAWLATHNDSITFLAAYIGYFGLLFLMLLGPANRNNANDNTSGVITLLEVLSALPEQYREKVCFVLFDKEEYGLVGSKAYRKKYKNETDGVVMLNLDCVGDGDHILLFPSKKLKKQPGLMDRLRTAVTEKGQKSVAIWEKSFQFNSDQKNYPISVGIGAFHYKKPVGFYCGRIHTARDTILETENITIIRDSLLRLLTDTE